MGFQKVARRHNLIHLFTRSEIFRTLTAAVTRHLAKGRRLIVSSRENSSGGLPTERC